ncbi:MAG: NAD(+) synthase, partial [Desulfofundulus sp.]
MSRDLKALLAIDPPVVADKICAFVKEQVAETGATGAVIGISGGLDSAVVAALVATAIGPGKVTGLFLPERDTAPESIACARAVAQSTGITLETLDLTRALEQIGAYRGKVPTAMKSAGVNRTAFIAMRRIGGRSPFEATFDTNKGNILNEAAAFFRVKHRLRMAALYHRAEREGRLVVGCLNRTERLMGFFVRYGDDAADFAPIIPLYKTQVRALASYLKVPEAVIGRPPSPDLIAGI